MKTYRVYEVGVAVSGQGRHHPRIAPPPSHPLVVLRQAKLHCHHGVEVGNVTQSLLRIKPSHIFSGTGVIGGGGAIVPVLQGEQKCTMLPSEFHHVIAVDTVNEHEVIQGRTLPACTIIGKGTHYEQGCKFHPRGTELLTDAEKHWGIGVGTLPVGGVEEISEMLTT